MLFMDLFMKEDIYQGKSSLLNLMKSNLKYVLSQTSWIWISKNCIFGKVIPLIFSYFAQI